MSETNNQQNQPQQQHRQGDNRQGGNNQDKGRPQGDPKSNVDFGKRVSAFFHNLLSGALTQSNGAKQSKGGVLASRLERLFASIADALGMILLLLYGPVLVYVAAIAFVPKANAVTLVAGISWAEIIAWVVTILFTSLHAGMKRVAFNLRNRESVVQTFKLVLRTILLSVGWIYFYFGNPWSSQPSQFAMPELSLLLDPVFVTIWIIILVDTWVPSFVRKQLID